MAFAVLGQDPKLKVFPKKTTLEKRLNPPTSNLFHPKKIKKNKPTSNRLCVPLKRACVWGGGGFYLNLRFFILLISAQKAWELSAAKVALLVFHGRFGLWRRSEVS